MSSVIEYLAMDGHGFYVWLSYAIAALVIGFNVLGPWVSFKQTKGRIEKMLRREGKVK